MAMSHCQVAITTDILFLFVLKCHYKILVPRSAIQAAETLVAHAVGDTWDDATNDNDDICTVMYAGSMLVPVRACVHGR